MRVIAGVCLSVARQLEVTSFRNVSVLPSAVAWLDLSFLFPSHASRKSVNMIIFLSYQSHFTRQDVGLRLRFEYC